MKKLGVMILISMVSVSAFADTGKPCQTRKDCEENRPCIVNGALSKEEMKTQGICMETGRPGAYGCYTPFSPNAQKGEQAKVCER